MISMSGATSATRPASRTEMTATRRPSSSRYVNGSMTASGTSWRSVAERTVSAWMRTPCMLLPRARGHPVGVEDAVDVAQLAHRRLERLRVRNLDHEAVLHHRPRHDAARLDDVDPRLGERPREVLEQAVAVPRVDLQLDLERGRVVALPVDAHEALGVLAQSGGVRTVVAVDRDAAPERHVADDRIAGHRAA